MTEPQKQKSQWRKTRNMIPSKVNNSIVIDFNHVEVNEIP